MTFIASTIVLASAPANATPCGQDIWTIIDQDCFYQGSNGAYSCVNSGDCNTAYSWTCGVSTAWTTGCVPWNLVPVGVMNGECEPSCPPTSCPPGQSRECANDCGIRLCDASGQWGACTVLQSCGDPQPPPPPGCNPNDSKGDPVNVRTGVTTFYPHRDDAWVDTPNGRMGIARVYSSTLAELDYEKLYYATHHLESAQRLALLSIPAAGWGIGWRHTYAYDLPALTHDDPVLGSVLDGVLFVNPEGQTRKFLFPSGSPTTVVSEDGTTFEPVSSSVWRIRTTSNDTFDFSPNYASSSPLSLHPALTAVAWESGLRAHVYHWGDAAFAPCASNPAGSNNRLCSVADDFGNNLWMGYGSDGKVAYLGQSVSGTVQGDGTFYHYADSAIKGVYSDVPDVTQTLLTDVDYSVYNGDHAAANNGSGFTTIDREHYAYTDMSYVRPDLGALGVYSQSQPIIMGVPWRGKLLTLVRDNDNRFITRHEYTKDAKTAAAIAPGEYLRFEYVSVSATEARTLYFNESAGTEGEYALSNGNIVDASDEQFAGCDLDPAHYTRDAAGVVSEKTERPVDASSSGVRTTYLKNAFGQPTLIQENWLGSPASLAPTVDNPLSPVRVRRLTYLPSSIRVASSSPVYSVACARASLFGITCGAGLSSFDPSTEYDYDSDYDQDFNENPGSRVTQVRMNGLTLNSSNALEAHAHVTQTHYDVNGRITSVSVVDNGSVLRLTEYAYYNDPSSHNHARLWTTSVNGEVVEERGNYDTWGLVGYIRDPRTSRSETRSYDLGHELLHDAITDGVSARYTHYEYNANHDLRVRREGANNVSETSWQYNRLNGIAGPDAGSEDLCRSAASGWSLSDCLRTLGGIVGLASTDHAYAGGYATRQFSRDNVGNTVLTKLYDSGLREVHGAAFDEHAQQTRKLSFTYSDTVPTYVEESYRDSAGRLVAKTEGRFANAGASHQDNFDDANIRYGYDALGRLTSITRGRTTVPQRTTAYKYDGVDNLISSTDPDGRITVYLYDDFGELIAVKSPDSGITAYRYSGLGQVVAAQYSDGRATAYMYDARGALISQTDAKGAASVSRTNHYDSLTGSFANVGASCMTNSNDFDVDIAQLATRLAWIEEDWGIRYFNYNAFGEVTAVYEQPGSAFDVCALTITRYGYNSYGDLTDIDYPSGTHVRWGDGTAGYPIYGYLRMLGATSESMFLDLTRHAGGPINYVGFRNFGTGSRLDVYRDLNGDFVGRRFSKNNVSLFDWSPSAYPGALVDSSERDGSGNILKVQDFVTSDGYHTAVNAFDELVSYRRPGASANECEYTYDDGGNRLSASCPNGSTAVYAYEPGTSRLASTTWSDVAPTCASSTPSVVNADVDEAGNVLSYAKDGCPSDVHTIDYDAAHRVSSFDANSSTAIMYDENHLATAMGARKLVYDLQGHLLSDHTGSVGVDYVWVDDTPVAIVQTQFAGSDAAVAVLGTDHLNAPWRAWVNGNTTSWSVSYDPFGTVTPGNGATSYGPTPSIALRRPGQISTDNGAFINQWRMYLSSSGRYTQEDPLIVKSPEVTRGQGINSATAMTQLLPYAYVSANPLNGVDPTGLVKAGDELPPKEGCSRTKPKAYRDDWTCGGDPMRECAKLYGPNGLSSAYCLEAAGGGLLICDYCFMPSSCGGIE